MPTPQISRRLVTLRTDNGYSLARVAKETKLSRSFLSLVEAGKSDISITRLMRLASFYGVKVGDLVSEMPDAAGVPNGRGIVVRQGAGRRLESVEEGVELTLLGPGGAKMRPVLMTLAVGAALREAASHEGEEFATVVAGRVSLKLGAEDLVLDAGDSAYFNAIEPHIYANAGSEAARVFLVITPSVL